MSLLPGVMVMSSTMRQHARWVPYFFLAPFLGVFLVFIAYPMALSASMAFQQNAGPGVSEPVGFKNFTWMVQDPAFWTAVKNTTIFAAASVFIQLPASLPRPHRRIDGRGQAALSKRQLCRQWRRI